MPIANVDLRDIGEVAVESLTNPRHHGMSYRLTGAAVTRGSGPHPGRGAEQIDGNTATKRDDARAAIANEPVVTSPMNRDRSTSADSSHSPGRWLVAGVVFWLTILTAGCTTASRSEGATSNTPRGSNEIGSNIALTSTAEPVTPHAVKLTEASPANSVESPADGGRVALVARSAATVLGYIVRTPQGPVSDSNLFPTIIYLHGFGERGDGSIEGLHKLEDTGLPFLSVNHELPVPARGFLILAPQTSAESWDPKLIDAWLNVMRSRYPIDAHRMYLTGISMGGGGVVSYLDTYGPAVPFAALAPISGDWTADGPVMGLPSCGRLSSTPIWAFAGDVDDVVPHQFSINLIGYLNRHCAPSVPDRLTLYQGRFHDVWTRTYDLTGQQDKVVAPWQPYEPDLYTWFLEYRRP